MDKYKLHCLIINQSPALTSELTKVLMHKGDHNIIETVDDKLHLIKAKLIHNQVSLIFVAKTNNSPSVEAVSNLLRQYSADTILVNITAENQPLNQSVSGIESCDVSLSNKGFSTLVMSNLLSYATLKKDFRECKQLLSIVDKRNRWLVNSTREPIAYIYQDAHVHANPAYLSLFGFHSVAELMASTIFDLIPANNHLMFKRFISKQKKYLDTNQSLLMSMNKADKRGFRAGIRVAPAVINNTRCLQIWVHELKLTAELEMDQSNKPESRENSPWKEMPEKKVINTNGKSNINKAASPVVSPTVSPAKTVPKKVTNNIAQPPVAPVNKSESKPMSLSASVNLKEQMKNRKAISTIKKQSLKKTIAFARQKQVSKLSVQRLKDVSTNLYTRSYVDIRMNTMQLNQIQEPLKESFGITIGMLRDYVLVSSLINILRTKGRSMDHYIVKLSTANLKDKRFNRWLSMQLQQLSIGSPKIVFLLKYDYCRANTQPLTGFLFALKNTEGLIGFDGYIPSATGSKLIKRMQVKYLIFSPEWLDSLKGNKRQLAILTSLTQKLEYSGVEIIESP